MLKDIETIIKIQNIYLLKYIAIQKNWNYRELCKKYIH